MVESKVGSRFRIRCEKEDVRKWRGLLSPSESFDLKNRMSRKTVRTKKTKAEKIVTKKVTTAHPGDFSGNLCTPMRACQKVHTCP